MSVEGRTGSTVGGRLKRVLGVQAALEWAFRVEQAQLELPLRPDIAEEGFGFAGGHRMRISGSYDPEALARLIRGLTV